jgi:hypothetical protein
LLLIYLLFKALAVPNTPAPDTKKSAASIRTLSPVVVEVPAEEPVPVFGLAVEEPPVVPPVVVPPVVEPPGVVVGVFAS